MRTLWRRLLHLVGYHSFVDCVVTDVWAGRFKGQACRFCARLGDTWERLA